MIVWRRGAGASPTMHSQPKAQWRPPWQLPNHLHPLPQRQRLRRNRPFVLTGIAGCAGSTDTADVFPMNAGRSVDSPLLL